MPGPPLAPQPRWKPKRRGLLQTRAIVVGVLLSMGLLAAYWAAGAQEGRSLWAPPAVLPADENSPSPPTMLPAPVRTDQPNPEQTQPQGAKSPFGPNGMMQAGFVEFPRPKSGDGAPAPGAGTPGVVVEESARVQMVDLPLPAPLNLPAPPGLPSVPTPSLPAPMFPAVTPPANDNPPPLPTLPAVVPAEPAKAPLTEPMAKQDPKVARPTPERPFEVQAVVPPPVVVPAPQNDLAVPMVAPSERRSSEPIKAFVRIRPDGTLLIPPNPPAVAPPVPAPLPSPAVEVKGAYVGTPATVAATVEVKGAYGGTPVNVAAIPATVVATPVRSSPAGSLQTPAVVVEKRANPTSPLAAGVHYQIIVRNLGAVPAQQVRVEDELPPDAKVLQADPAPHMQGNKLIWTLSSLAAQSEEVLRVALDARGASETTDRMTVAVIGSVPASRDRQRTESPIHVAERPQLQAGALAVRVVEPPSVSVGQALVLDIRVTNQSGLPISGLVLHSYLPEGLSHPRGRELEGAVDMVLQPGETKSVELTVRAVQAGHGMMGVKVTTPAGLEATAQTPIEIKADTVQLQHGLAGRLFAGVEGDYRIEIKNCTSQPLRNLLVTDQMAPGLECVSSSDRGLYRVNERKVTWQIEQLPAGQSQTLTMRVFAAKAAQYQNQVTVQADGAEAVRSDAAVVAEANSNIVMTIKNRDTKVAVGRQTVYEIQVTNTGNVPTTRVQLQALFSSGLTPRVAQAPGKTKYTLDRQSVTFEPLASLPAHAKVIFRVTAQGQEAGEQHVRFAISSDQVRPPILSEASITVQRD